MLYSTTISVRPLTHKPDDITGLNLIWMIPNGDSKIPNHLKKEKKSSCSAENNFHVPFCYSLICVSSILFYIKAFKKPLIKMQFWLSNWRTVISHDKSITRVDFERAYWLMSGAYLSTGEDFEFRGFFTWAYKASTVCPSLGLCGRVFSVIVPLFEEES